jgi:hypothetical protein
LVRGDKERALDDLRKGHALWRTTDLGLGTGLRYAIATLEGGDSGRAERAQIHAQIEAEGWQSMRRGLAVRVPIALSLLE